MELTIRNVPEDIVEKINSLSRAEQKSLNSKFLSILEKSLKENRHRSDLHTLTKEAQVKTWRKLATQWEDDRSPQEIIRDVYEHRTAGRVVTL